MPAPKCDVSQLFLNDWGFSCVAVDPTQECETCRFHTDGTWARSSGILDPPSIDCETGSWTQTTCGVLDLINCTTHTMERLTWSIKGSILKLGSRRFEAEATPEDTLFRCAGHCQQ